ncbi:unnamed protein product [Parascedosporium putredinis]|uniref:Cystinosin n=1 Tax=Parascedosporium putredinis TaxID=1442378 RepID=A0A9P1GUD6_9PEZI|nr:unnamed protein product [Parascedosporium putredinis]CAI7987278.1 unnamed protein product [Parascedosporium putredinis]
MAPPSTSPPASAFLPVLSGLFGWVYTIAWSLSFYPQPLLNYRRRSTSGTTVDFPFINTLGFLAYFFSTAAFLWSPLIREQYAARHHGLVPTVRGNDVAFAGHALVLSCITVSQYHPTLWGFRPGGARPRPSRPIFGVALGSLLAVVLVSFVVIAAAGPDLDPASDWCALDIVYAASYVKLLITLLAIDSYLQQDWSGITGNPVKFGLGNVSLAYDAIFITQHYFLYPHESQSPPPTTHFDPDADTDPDADVDEPLLRRQDLEDRRAQ